MIVLQNSLWRVEILENIGMTVSQIYYQGIPLLYFPFSEKEYSINQSLAGIPLMYPFANRLSSWSFSLLNQSVHLSKNQVLSDSNNLPIHGLILKSNEWKIIYQGPSGVEAEFCFVGKWKEVFPFSHCLKYLIQLFEKEVRFILIVIGIEDTPVSFGFHPYFRLWQEKQNLQIALPTSKVIELNPRLLPTGKLIPLEDFLIQHQIPFQKTEYYYIFSLNFSFDHGFLISDGISQLNEGISIQLIQEKYKLQLLLDSNYRVLQLYSPLIEEGKNFFCMEPMIAITNSFLDGGYGIVPKGNQKVFRFSLRVEN
ncbi:MAG: aldose 1-epimerase [Leptospiraceae bacterium]|nr:aldose 1-epimerase [Leptospiraceae bacterium]MDW7975064.1 aldose 1-epimerase [Leptospiraceae bacterium]